MFQYKIESYYKLYNLITRPVRLVCQFIVTYPRFLNNRFDLFSNKWSIQFWTPNFAQLKVRVRRTSDSTVSKMIFVSTLF